MNIADAGKERWIDFWANNSTDNLFDKATDNLIIETHRISEKIGTTVKFTKLGFDFYLVSVVLMAIVALTMVILAAITA